MRIAICEDSHRDSARLLAMLEDYLRANGLTADVERFSSGEALLAAFSPGKYQILFQDIYMKKTALTGVETAAKIRETDRELTIIFVTVSSEHGAESYDVSAAYYIVKPLEQEKLRKAMEKCRALLDKYTKSIDIVENRQMVAVRLRDIRYAEVIRHQIIIRTVSGEIQTRMVFGELAAQLADAGLILCHRSYIVNPMHIADKQGRDFIMKNGDKIPISRTFQRQAEKAFRAFLWED